VIKSADWAVPSGADLQACPAEVSILQNAFSLKFWKKLVAEGEEEEFPKGLVTAMSSYEGGVVRWGIGLRWGDLETPADHQVTSERADWASNPSNLLFFLEAGTKKSPIGEHPPHAAAARVPPATRVLLAPFQVEWLAVVTGAGAGIIRKALNLTGMQITLKNEGLAQSSKARKALLPNAQLYFLFSLFVPRRFVAGGGTIPSAESSFLAAIPMAKDSPPLFFPGHNWYEGSKGATEALQGLISIVGADGIYKGRVLSDIGVFAKDPTVNFSALNKKWAWASTTSPRGALYESLVASGCILKQMPRLACRLRICFTFDVH
jgi:hypothetical protein